MPRTVWCEAISLDAVVSEELVLDGLDSRLQTCIWGRGRRRCRCRGGSCAASAGHGRDRNAGRGPHPVCPTRGSHLREFGVGVPRTHVDAAAIGRQRAAGSDGQAAGSDGHAHHGSAARHRAAHHGSAAGHRAAGTVGHRAVARAHGAVAAHRAAAVEAAAADAEAGDREHEREHPEIHVVLLVSEVRG